MGTDPLPNPPPALKPTPRQRRDACATVRELIALNAEVAPHQSALFGPEAGIHRRYAELHQNIDDMAHRLTAIGLAKGSCVSFLLGNGIATVELMLAAMVAGFRCAPLNPAAGATQLAYVFNHCEAEIVFVSADHQPLLADLLICVDRKVLVIPTSVDDGPQWPSTDRENHPELATIEADDDALLMYTSGTTGNPKGVLLTHRNVIAGGRNVSVAHHLGSADRALCILPLCHINAQIVTVLGPLASGSAVVVPHRFSGSRFWGWIADYHCTWFSAVPTIFARLLQDTDTPPATISAATQTLRFGRSASAPLPPALHQNFEQRFGIRIIETMGLTETAAPILSNPMPPQQIRFGSPGLAVGNQVRIVGRDGNELPPGTEGQIVVRGANVMRGYLKDATATADAIDAAGWFQTGDLGYMDADGYVFVSGRLKELIIKGGENIAPREIDDALYSHPAVVEAGAVGLADPTYGEVVVAAVVVSDSYPNPGASLASELIAWCADRVGAFKAPQAIYFRSSLPKGPSGKVQRRKLIDDIKFED